MCCTWINTSGEGKTQLIRLLNKSRGLRKWLLRWGVFFFFLHSILIGLVLEDHSSKLHSRHWKLSLNNHSSLYFLKTFKCIFVATSHQANDLPETGMSKQGMKTITVFNNVYLKWWPVNNHNNSTKNIRTWISHRGSAKTVNIGYCNLVMLRP